MSKLFDAAKNLAKKFRDRIFGGPDIRGNTTSKDPAPASRYLWVSKVIPEGVAEAISTGLIPAQHPLIRRVMRQAKGSTYNVGSNEAKRTVDKLFGSNKERRRARTRFRALRDGMLANAA